VTDTQGPAAPAAEPHVNLKPAEPEFDLQAEYEALLEFVSLCPHGLVQFDGTGAITMANPAFARIAMPLLPPGEQFSNIIDVLRPYLPDLPDLLGGPAIAGTMQGGGTICEGLLVPLGPPRPGQDRGMLSLTLVRFANDRFMAVVEDVTRQVAQEQRLKDTEAYLVALAQGTEDYAAFSIDADGRVTDWNQAAQRMLGHAAEAVIGRPAAGLVTIGHANPAGFRARLRAAARDGWHLDQGWRERADGTRFWGSCMLSPVHVASAAEGAAPARYLMVVRDTTEQRNAAEELHRALTLDHLTGVLNRRMFFERAETELRRQAERGATSCVAMLDADHFKAVNDTHGHAAGDAALRAIARVLQGATRAEDMVGRLGGEEFAILLPGTAPALAGAVAERLRAGVAALALEHAGDRIPLTVSVGFAAGTTTDLQSLLIAADGALYVAKRSGRNRVCRAISPAAALGS
jgi:diguanylate cyclase (GGDEF)-like protein/PAS domain S-box-containing protein